MYKIKTGKLQGEIVKFTGRYEKGFAVCDLNGITVYIINSDLEIYDT